MVMILFTVILEKYNDTVKSLAIIVFYFYLNEKKIAIEKKSSFLRRRP